VSAGRVARRIVVHGRVQGVFFRATVRDAARAAGAAGWAHNRDDGTVEVWVEGEPDAADAVVAACRTGSPASRVDQVDVEEAEPEGLSGFYSL
jgi:acylphosphatase